MQISIEIQINDQKKPLLSQQPNIRFWYGTRTSRAFPKGRTCERTITQLYLLEKLIVLKVMQMRFCNNTKPTCSLQAEKAPAREEETFATGLFCISICCYICLSEKSEESDTNSCFITEQGAECAGFLLQM